MSLGTITRKRNMPRHAVVQPSDLSIKLIPLTRGQNATVDAADYDWLNQFNWCAQYVKARDCFYAIRRDGDRVLFMHCQLLDTEKDVDHEDRDTLNNRRHNLRESSRSCNIANRPKQCNNTSGFKGVFFNSQKNKWQAKVHVKGSDIHAGFYRDVTDAARAFDVIAIREFGEFAYTNFPRSDYGSEVA